MVIFQNLFAGIVAASLVRKRLLTPEFRYFLRLMCLSYYFTFQVVFTIHHNTL